MKGWQMKPPKREKRGYRWAAETPEEREKQDYSKRALTSVKGWQLKPSEEREVRLEHYSTRYREQQSVQPQLPLFQQCSIQAKM